MQGRNLLIAGIAVFLGLVAVYLANAYFSGMEEQQEEIAEQQQLARIVVASQPLAFGQQLTDTNVRLVNWPSDSVPQGAFTSLEQAMLGGRVALRPIVPGEPVLASKVSGDNGRATLASNLPEDMRAVSIPINDVSGVGGFVRPGDVVDVILTRQIPGEGAQQTDKMTTVALENVLVLGIDQVADENNTEPVLSKTATLQTDIYGAQKLALAREIGVLSLALRNVENQEVGATETVVANDLGGEGRYVYRRMGGAAPAVATPSYSAAPRGASSAPQQASAPARPRGPTMSVVRGTEAETYSVEALRGY
ncbi:Flp pilus assembly protein CpaB [Qipengyuania gaetbuli]|uniref:Flp pilus assembly protein CpaB n=1 Tax=Qipengyuania gaetbuli TaxID=266952 RepID=UPI001CD26E89|nr:Flp pilus assembly protein CpaB [Qipengyuania gaetbuli]MCA0910399.1 Flp pilus assembly protein CpaB [Qipengyuania gaetbuli]